MTMFSSYKKLLHMMTALSFIIFGSSIIQFREEIFSIIIKSQLVIEEGTAAYNAWVKTPIPVYTKFYFFSLQSPAELYHRHEKPLVEERGPYTFREFESKKNIVWHDNGTVSYTREKYWNFERTLSVGPLSDTIVTVNVPAVAAAEFARGNMLMEWGVSDMLATLEARLFVNRTIGELLFDGYEDDVMKIADNFANDIDEDHEEENYFDEYYEEHDDDNNNSKDEARNESKVPMDKFGWFYKRNGTDWSDGYLTMYTGTNNITQLGTIFSWNNSTSTEAYPGSCGQVRGSSDGLFPPGKTSHSNIISLFSTDLCRPIHFVKHGQEELHGIPVNTFLLSSDNFANSSVCPDNHCYNNNLPTGVQNVTKCKTDSPVFVSRPHFHQADKFYKNQFQSGIDAKEGVHDSVLWVEPKSSIPVKVNIRMQLNVFIRKVAGIEYLFKNLTDLMFPVFWFETQTSLPESMAGSINLLLMLPDIMQGCGICSVVSSVIIIIIIILHDIRKRKQDKYSRQIGCYYTKVPWVAGSNGNKANLSLS